MLLNNHAERTALLDELAQLTPTSALANNMNEWIVQIRQSANEKKFPGAVLPIHSDGRVIFYAVAETGMEWRELAPLLMASVGVTTTDFQGRANQGPAGDQIAEMLRARGLFAVSRFEAYGDTSREKNALQALVRLCNQLRSAAAFSRGLPRSTQQALYEFRLALATGHLAAAEEVLTFLRDKMRMDALNRSFLEVRLDEAFGAWDRLVRRDTFAQLCLTRRPPAVTAAMAEALYRTVIAEVEQEDDPQAALNVFRDKILDRSGTLFTVCPPEPRPAVGIAFLLAALASSKPDRQLIERLTKAAQSWPPEEKRFFERLLNLIPSPPSDGQSTAAPVEMRVGLTDYQAQLDLAAQDQSLPTPERAEAVLIAAAGLQTLEAYRFAISYSDRLDELAREQLFTRPFPKMLWEQIISYGVSKRIPHDWCEWIELLPQMSIAQATQWAERAVAEYPLDHQLQRPEDVTTLANMLNNPPAETEERLFNALPELVTWIQADNRWPNKAYSALYQQLFDLLLMSGNRSPKLYDALTIVLSGMLAVGLDGSTYNSVLSDLGDALPGLSGARDLDWLVDLAELVITYPCPDLAARARFWTQLIALLAQYGTRTTALHRIVLTDVAEILGQSETLAVLPAVLPGAGASAQALSLDHQLVGIYTLTEGVGERVGQILRAEYPTVDVQVNHDHVSTPKLRELARRADIFVVCWLSAKHAATDAISQARSQDAITVFAPGKGSSSIVREIIRHLDEHRVKAN